MIIRNLFSLIPAYYALHKDVKRQKRFVKTVLEPDIENAIKGNDGTLDDADFQKVRGYYGFGVPAIVGESICTLRGKVMDTIERTANTYQGALTGLYDDFFDKTHLDKADIKKMMLNPASYAARTSLEKLFIHFLGMVHKNLSDQAYFTDMFNKVFQAQIDSGDQAEKGISRDAIKDITFRKGGYSLLFYRSVFHHKLHKGEEEALFNAGGLMQLGNDIFDVWEDEQQQIKTLLTSCKNINEVRQIFLGQLQKTAKLFQQSGFPHKNINTFLHKFVLGISRCLVCLDQLESLEHKTGGKFMPSAYTREELICDMEKPGNMLSSVRYYLAYKF
ncbi:MAG: hypothetical protein ABFS05_07135 [Bacteroidota bacterium]